MIELSKLLKNIESQNMQAFYVENVKEAKALVDSLIPDGVKVMNGGSRTLANNGFLTMFEESDRYNYVGMPKDATDEERDAYYLERFTSDVFLCSANALLETGEIYQVDGASTRIAPLIYGPKSVIMVVGINKIVKDLDEAIARVRCHITPTIASWMAPDAPCVKLGKCVADGKAMGKGCMVDARRCCNFVLMGRQRVHHRIKVIIVGESVGL